MKKIKWNVVTWYSKLLALTLFVGLPFLGFYFGIQYEKIKNLETKITTLEEFKTTTKITPATSGEKVINSATFYCAENKTIHGIFFEKKVELTLSDSRNMLLSQAISASGARYANSDESFVFWNKGSTAFIKEGEKITFKDCLTKTSQ